jgi:hypothetical protein
MRDDHGRFRSLLAAYLAEVLPDEDGAWLEQHVAACPSCAGLIERVRRRLPELAHDGGHIPVSLLERWALEPGSMTPLERELVRRHVADCEICRGDAEELIAAAGRPGQRAGAEPRAATLRRWVVPTAAAAAVLLLVFLVRGAFLTRVRTVAVPRGGEVTGGSGGAGPEATNPVAANIVVIALAERQRSARPEGLRARGVIAPADSLQLELPALFIPEGDTVVARILRADGGLVWGQFLNASALGANLAPGRPVEGWRPGRYRLVLIPRAGRDTAATREYVFELDERTR